MLSSPTTARRGNLVAGMGMTLAIVSTFLMPGMKHQLTMIVVILVVGAIGWFPARRVPIADMPQMVALFNGMGGGAAAVISSLELARGELGPTLRVLAVLGGLIGSLSFGGSMGAFMKLQRLMGDRPVTYPLQRPFHALLVLLSLSLGYIVLAQSAPNVSTLSLVIARPPLVGLLFSL